MQYQYIIIYYLKYIIIINIYNKINLFINTYLN